MWVNIRRVTLRSCFAAALLLSSSMTPAWVVIAQAAKSEPSDGDAFKAFGNSNYGYCDAEVLGRFWKMSVSDAKVLIGRKIIWRNETVLDKALRQAWSQGGCVSGMLLDDAARVAEFWTAAV